MNQIAEIQKSKFACFSHLTPEVKNEQITALFYIERMAGVTNTNISQIDIFDVFGRKDADKALLITSKGEINKRLASIPSTQPVQLEGLGAAVDSALAAMQSTFLKRANSRIEELRRSKNSHIRSAEDYAKRVDDYLKAAWQIDTELSKLTGNEFDFKGEFKKIADAGFWEISEVKDGQVTFVNKNDIVLVYKNTKAGVDYQVAMGKYRAIYDGHTNTVKVKNFERNPIVSNAFYHPYVNSSGSVCFGNAASQAQRYLAEFNLGEYFGLLSALMTTYSPDSAPYVSLEAFQDAAKRGNYTIKPPCRRCGVPQGECPCVHCPKCDETYDRYGCREHYCTNCQTHNLGDCDCCRECSSQTSSDPSSHEGHCSYRQDAPQTATILADEDGSDDDSEVEF